MRFDGGLEGSFLIVLFFTVSLPVSDAATKPRLGGRVQAVHARARAYGPPVRSDALERVRVVSTTRERHRGSPFDGS